MTTTQAIATEIRNQIGTKALFLLGAKDIFCGETAGLPWLSFKIRGSKRVNYIKIYFDGGADLYNMEFIKYTSTKVNTIAKHEGIYADMMHELIEQETGLFTYFK